MIDRIIEFCVNPQEATEKFNDGLTDAVFSSKIAAMTGEVAFLDHDLRLEEMSIESLQDKEHYVLYSGGKESLLTCKILDFYNIKYKKVVFNESVKNIDQSILDEADVVISSEIIEEYGNDAFGRHIPLVAYYVGVVAELYPHSVIWVGAANVNENVRYMLGNGDHSDYAFDEYSYKTNCEVYSCVNSLSEFDIYRIAVDYFDYDASRSYSDNPDKVNRINAFHHAHLMFKHMDKIPSLEKLMMFDKNFNLSAKMFLKKPTIYDFRSDIRLFLSSIEEFDW